MCNIHLFNNFLYMVVTKELVLGDTYYNKFVTSCVFPSHKFKFITC